MRSVPENTLFKTDVTSLLPESNESLSSKDLHFIHVHFQLPKPLSFQRALLPSHLDTSNHVIIEDFDSNSFPRGNWHVFDFDGSVNGEYFWGVTNNRFLGGAHSAWCARGGAEGTKLSELKYPNNCFSWMVYGPIDLSGIDSVRVKFSYFLDTQLGRDFFYWLASEDGENFSGVGVSGNTGSQWKDTSFSLADSAFLGDLTGKSQAWIAFAFSSDDSIIDEGVYIDNISIQAFPTPPESQVIMLIPDTSVTFASSVALPIRVSKVTGLGIYGVETELTYEDSVLGMGTVASLHSTIIPPNSPFLVVNAQPGQLTFTYANSLPLSGKGNLLWFTFGINGIPGDIMRIHFENLLLNEGRPVAIPVDGVFRIDGKKGDINNDHVLNILDVILIVSIIQGKRIPTPYERWAADCNGDGRINILDITLLVKWIQNARLN